MDITFKGRQTDVAGRFREHAAAKLARLEKLDSNAIRVDVEVSVERNPRLASQKERVELTIRSKGPAIRAEAAAEDRYCALDMAIAKLDSRLRRAIDRRKNHHGTHSPVRLIDQLEGEEMPLPPEPAAPGTRSSADPAANGSGPATGAVAEDGASAGAGSTADVVPIPAQGRGPLLVRQKYHQAKPMSIDQALLEMELVGHDFYLFQDASCGLPSVVYRRRGYQYGVLRLVESGTGNGSAAVSGTRRDAAAVG